MTTEAVDSTTKGQVETAITEEADSVPQRQSISTSHSLRTTTEGQNGEQTSPEATTQEAEKASADENGGHSVQFILLMSAACLSAFLVGLDQTIITTAIPQITDQFHSPADVGWYGSAYLLTSCAFQPIYGQVYKNFEIRRVYFLVLAVFLAGSIICAAAPTSNALIVGRALAGLGCAGVLSGNLNIVSKSVSLDKRPVYVSMLGTIFGISLVCGPIIGGALTSRATWRWCFWINLPIGVVTTVAIFTFFRPPKALVNEASVLKRLTKLDLLGSLLVITSAIMLLLALQWGGVNYAWSDSRIIGLLVGSGVEALVFFTWQYYRGMEALVPLHILSDRTVAATILSSFFQSGATFLPIFYLPYWFQVVKGASSLTAGVDMIPWMVGNFLAALVISIVVSKTGYLNPPVLAGPVIGAVGQGLLITLNGSTCVGRWVGYQILNSIGLGAARQQYFLAVQTVLTPADIPIAIAFVLFCQNLGGSVFLSVANALIRNSLSSSLSTYTFTNVSSAAILSAGPTELRGLVELEQLGVLTDMYNTALRSVWILGVPIVVLSIICALPMRWVDMRAGKRKPEQQLQQQPQPQPDADPEKA